MNEIALTSEAQIHKLQVILKELDQRLGLEDRSQIKWDVKRESRSQMGFGSKATSRQMLLLPSWRTDSWRDLLLPQQTLKLELLALGEKKKNTDMIGFCFLINCQWVLCVFLLINKDSEENTSKHLSKTKKNCLTAFPPCSFCSYSFNSKAKTLSSLLKNALKRSRCMWRAE